MYHARVAADLLIGDLQGLRGRRAHGEEAGRKMAFETAQGPGWWR
jgi:hypothetical protein